MIKDTLFHIKYSLSQIRLNGKKEVYKRLQQSFGKPKEEQFEFESIEKYFRNKKTPDAFQVLSDKTCNDLDIDELFMYVDRTHSKVGQQYLYHKLRTITPDTQQTELNEKLITELSKNEAFRISVQKQLEKLNHKDAYYITTLFQDKHISRPQWFWAIQLLAFASLASLLLTFFKAIFFVPLLVIFCINFVLHYWNKKNPVQYVASIPQLLCLNAIAANLYAEPLFKEINPDLPKAIKIINEIKSRMSFFQLEAKLQGEFEVIAWFVFETFKTMFLLEPLLLFGVLKRLDTKRAEIESVFSFVGHIDMLISIASLRKGLHTYCLPDIQHTADIVAEDLSHPLIINCTTNSITIDKKSILLTGSNMSGKTSFIRAMGLNVITGLTLNTCFAKNMAFPLLRVFSAIRISDDLMNDKSYYFEEVLTIKELLNQSKDNTPNLFLLDELFKGTNTVERIAAGKAVLEALNQNHNKVLVSTHDIELTDMLSENYELYHFSETVANNSVGFDYKLKEGKLKNRNAIRILALNDYPETVVKEALAVSQELDKTYLKNKA